MTLEEAIEHCEEVAEKNEHLAEKWSEEGGEKFGKTMACRECASEHRLLAEWLKELQISYKYIKRKEMKKIEEIIKAYESNKDEDKKDVLYYLKNALKMEEEYLNIKAELDALKDRDWKNKHVPLSWDDIKQMVGKPIWIKSESFDSQWYIVVIVTENLLVCSGKHLHSYQFYYSDKIEGNWEAYREEKE